MNILSRFSFSSRLVIVAFAAAIGPIAIAYVAMLDLPAKVARDALELTLREEAQEISAGIRDERLELREEVARLADDPAFRRALARGEQDAALRLLDDPAGVELTTYDPDEPPPQEAGPINAPVVLDDGDRRRGALIFRRLDGDALDELRGNAPAPVALTVGADVTARSAGFPEKLDLRTSGIAESDTRGRLYTVDQPGDAPQLHLFDHPLGLDARYHLVVASTPELERVAVEEPRSDVVRSVLLLAVATAIFAVAGATAVNRSVRRFADRTAELARGNYSVRLPVQGSDTFARLAASFNQLAAEIENRINLLEQGARRYEQTLQTIEEGICVWTADGELALWNRGAERMTGLTQEQLPDSELLEFLRKEQTPGTRRVTLPVHRAGARLITDLVVTPMPGGGVLQTFRDMTTLEALNQTRRNFMATAAHELRTPLTTILGFSQTMAEGAIELTEQQRVEFLGLIYEQARHLQRLTDAFFTNHQLANERVEVSLEPVGVLDAVLKGVTRVELEREQAGEPTVEIDVKVDPAVHVRSDRRALAGIVAILVDNAFKYGDEPIRVTAERAGGSVVLTVRDNGPGIAEHHLERIFDPFYRVDVDMRTGVGGAGLGLFTARKLVSALKGVIRVESSPDHGTTFSVELPLAAPPASGAGARTQARPDAARRRRPPRDGRQGEG